MMVIGLTGGIGMGKSTLTKQFAFLGAKTANADTIVHSLISPGGAGVEPVGKAFKGVVKNGAVDRKALRGIVFDNKEERKKLESILHPLVVAEEEEFVRRMQRFGAELIVLDIPLLFETGAEKRCDYTVLASAPRFIQRQRVLARKGMTEEIFQRIKAAQMPEDQKEDKADFIIPTGLGKPYSLACAKRLLREIA